MPCPFSPVSYYLLGTLVAQKLVPPHLQKALGPRGNTVVSISLGAALGAAGIMLMRWLSRRGLKKGEEGEKVMQSLPGSITLRWQDVKRWDAVDEDIREEECCLCLDLYQKDDILQILPCKHYFHQECINRWFTEQQRLSWTCPKCRRNPLERRSD